MINNIDSIPVMIHELAHETPHCLQLLKKIENFGLLCKYKKCNSKSKGDKYEKHKTRY